MDINFTFFVQAFHFFIAYKILEKFFCRPTLTALEKEKKVYSDLISFITVQQQQVIKKELDKQNEWNRIKLVFSQSFPSLLSTKSKKISLPGPTPPHISPDQKKEYKDALQSFLLQRLRNVE